MVTLAIRLADYEVPGTEGGSGETAGGFVRPADPDLPPRYQASRGDAAWQRAMRLGAEARRGSPRLN